MDKTSGMNSCVFLFCFVLLANPKFKALLINKHFHKPSMFKITMFIHQAPKALRNIKSLKFGNGKQPLKSNIVFFSFSLMTLDTSVEKHDIPKRNMKETCKFIFCEKVCSVPFIQMCTYFLYKRLI